VGEPTRGFEIDEISSPLLGTPALRASTWLEHAALAKRRCRARDSFVTDPIACRLAADVNASDDERARFPSGASLSQCAISASEVGRRTLSSIDSGQAQGCLRRAHSGG
jgi:hypothetical protein